MNLINLMPHRHRQVQRRRRRFLGGLTVCLLGACILVLAASLSLERLHAVQASRNAVLEQARASLQKQEGQVQQLQAEMALLHKRQVTADALEQQRNTAVEVFKEIARVTPAGLALTSVRQSDFKLLISGLAVSNERVSDLLARLQLGSWSFQQAELVEMRAVEPTRPDRVGTSRVAGAVEFDGVGERRVEFTLSVHIRRDSLAGEGRT